MPQTPAKPGHRVLSFEFPDTYIEHLDRQARREDRSRAAYLRRLIAADIERIQATTQS